MSRKRTRGNGEGTIYFKESKKLWVMQYTLGRTQEGNFKRKTLYGKTRKEVKEKYEKLITDINTNNFVDKSNIIFKDLCMEIIEYGYKMNKLSDCSYIRKKETYKMICNHYMADLEIQKITEYDIKDFFSYIIKYSNGTIGKIYGLVNSTFKKAVRKNIISYNYLDDKEEFFMPKSNKQDKKIRSLTIEEEKKLISVLKNEDVLYKYQYLLELFSGMRMGEINALKLESINFQDKSIYIDKTITKDLENKGIIGKKGKTKKATREITMDNQVCNILKEYIENYYIPNDLNLLFYDHKKQRVISTSQVNMAFKRLCEKYNITNSNVNQHMLRHTFATRQIESGTPAQILKEILGHEEISTTLDTYTDIFNKYKEEHSKRFNEYLKQTGLQFYDDN